MCLTRWYRKHRHDLGMLKFGGRCLLGIEEPRSLARGAKKPSARHSKWSLEQHSAGEE